MDAERTEQTMAINMQSRLGSLTICFAMVLASPCHGCGGKDGKPPQAQLRLDSLPVDVTPPSLTDSQAQTFCARWSDAIAVEDARLGDKEGCLVEALQDSPDDVGACEAAFRDCMSYDDGSSGGSSVDDGWCADFTAAVFSGCTFTMGQVQACVNSTVAAYEALMRSATCAVYVPRGGLAAFGADREAATMGTDQPSCAGVDWSCDGGSLQGFRAFEDFATD